MNKHAHIVVIVGGGAGGLELAAKLGRKFGPSHVFLVDRSGDHIWKPSLHEVAAGTLDIHREGLSYAMLAKDCGFTFILGEVRQIDRRAHRVCVQPVMAAGQEIFPERSLHYDSLVIAVGSKCNYFDTPGASEFAIALDSTRQAERFRQRLLHEMVLTDQRKENDGGKALQIAIVGGGATGVELAAELIEACKNLSYYGLSRLDPRHDVKITLLEGAPRILSALPEKMSYSASRLLEERGVNVRTSVRVATVESDALIDTNQNRYPCDLCVWAAGIEAPEFLTQLGLETNRLNQIVVDECLRTSDPAVFAIGDCAQAPWNGGAGVLPARAQVAHQQASFLVQQLGARIEGKLPSSEAFRFKDYGSLVSVGHLKGVGSLMGVLSGRSWFVEGLVARTMYMSLHLMHHWAVLGFARTGSMALGRMLLKRSAPRVKLH